MKDLSEIEERLAQALARIEDAFREARLASNESDVSALAAENGELRRELETLRKQREDDIEHLEQLIAQLTPLIEEVL